MRAKAAEPKAGSPRQPSVAAATRWKSAVVHARSAGPGEGARLQALMAIAARMTAAATVDLMLRL